MEYILMFVLGIVGFCMLIASPASAFMLGMIVVGWFIHSVISSRQGGE